MLFFRAWLHASNARVLIPSRVHPGTSETGLARVLHHSSVRLHSQQAARVPLRNLVRQYNFLIFFFFFNSFLTIQLFLFFHLPLFTPRTLSTHFYSFERIFCVFFSITKASVGFQIFISFLKCHSLSAKKAIKN